MEIGMLLESVSKNNSKGLVRRYGGEQVKAMWDFIKQYDRSDSKGWIRRLF